MSKLNPRQQQAVKYIEGPLLVLAGAGSGKTSVITRKIAYLIEQCGISAKRICAVTFTNKAAKEMRERVSHLIQGKEAQGLSISTFHTLGLNILKREHAQVGLKNGFTIFDDTDVNTLLTELLLHTPSGDTSKKDSIRYLISKWKNDLVEPARAASHAADQDELFAAHVYGEYDRHLRAYNAVDFDDLIALPVFLFRQHAAVLERWQNRIHYLLVDEYQDTNSAQYELVKLLVGSRQQFTVVGDDDQSIYAWRGARPENLAQLAEDYPKLQVIKLEQNYRSSGRILKAANQVIANNPHVFEKKLWSEHGFGDEIRIIVCQNEEHEAEKVAGEILNQKIRHNRKFRDFAVLYRGNYQAKLVEMKLQHLQIPYKMSGGTSFFSRPEIKDFMGYLRVLINTDDDNAFLRIINTPRREIGPSTLEKLGNYASERGVSLFDATFELGLETRMQAQHLTKLRHFSHWMNETRRRLEEDDPIAAIKQMLVDIGYHQWLMEQSSSPKVADKRMDNVLTLVDSINRMLEKHEEPDVGTVINKLFLMDLLDQQQQEDDSDRVQLMTLHASKGLEFPHVFLMGLEEEILPHRNSIDADTVEEERRLMYVGITRAQKTLTMTLAQKRKQFGEMQSCTPSRFLDELPAEDLVWEGRGGEKSKEEKQELAKAHLASIRDLLNRV